ncbi:hypothetical protein D3C72_1867540 [compost metagenome]
MTESYPVQSQYLIHEHNNELTLNVPHDKMIGEILADLKIPVNLIKDVQIAEGNLEEAFLEVVNAKGAQI